METVKIVIGGAETFSVVDWPGKIAAVVFMQGCPWRCPFCYNQALQPAAADTGFDWEKFKEFLSTRKRTLDGVVFSGGEPLMQPVALAQAVGDVKALGFKVGLHTGGFRPEALQNILPNLDWVGLDIKAPLEEDRYAEAIGLNSPSPSQGEARRGYLSNILQTIKLLVDSRKDFECRTTCDPRILDIKDIYKIADSLEAMGVKKYALQKYRPVEGDKLTQDSDCEKFLADGKLKKYLEEIFERVEFRK